MKFLILFDNTNLLFFPGQFLSGRVLLELLEDTPALGEMKAKFTLFCLLGKSAFKEEINSRLLCNSSIDDKSKKGRQAFFFCFSQ